MSFFENLKSFLTLAKETNFDLTQIYTQNPDALYSFIFLVIGLSLIAYFFITKSIKTSSAINLVSKIQDSKNLDDYSSKLTKLVSELPKRGLKLATSLNDQKSEILTQELALIKNLDIKEKIAKYEEIASQYASLAKNSKKFKIDELTSFYEKKSKSLLNEDLKLEIEEYYKNARFDENDIENVNAIVSYAKRTSNSEEILNPLKQEIDRLSFGFSLDVYKFINGLDKNLDIYNDCQNRFNDLLSNSGIISENILLFMLDNDKKEEVYKYISTCGNETHLKALYKSMFSKTEDIDLDLAFVANQTKIDVDYKTHIDNRLTQNWKDLPFIKHIINSNGILETIGHIDYRNVLERVERLETEDENTRKIELALETAKRAETIAIEAKTLARSK